MSGILNCITTGGARNFDGAAATKVHVACNAPTVVISPCLCLVADLVFERQRCNFENNESTRDQSLLNGLGSLLLTFDELCLILADERCRRNTQTTRALMPIIEIARMMIFAIGNEPFGLTWAGRDGLDVDATGKLAVLVPLEGAMIDGIESRSRVSSA